MPDDIKLPSLEMLASTAEPVSPELPPGYIYGPWWDPHRRQWLCLDQWGDVWVFSGIHCKWGFDGLDLTSEIIAELLRIAEENKVLKAKLDGDYA